MTGAHGQVGSELVQALAKHSIFGSDILAPKRSEFDFTRREEVFGALISFGPDIVFHCGAMTAVDLCEDDPDAAYLANAISTRYLKQASRLIGARIVYLSTDYVFDGTSSNPYREWDPTNPASVYGKSKLAGEIELGESDLVVRTSWVMGQYGKNTLKTVLRLAKGDSPLRFVDDQIGSPTVVSDLVAAMIGLVLSDATGVFHISNAGSVSWYELVRFVFEVIGQDPTRITPISSSEIAASRRAPRPAFSVLDNCAYRLWGFDPLPHYRDALPSLIKLLLPQT